MRIKIDLVGRSLNLDSSHLSPKKEIDSRVEGLVRKLDIQPAEKGDLHITVTQDNKILIKKFDGREEKKYKVSTEIRAEVFEIAKSVASSLKHSELRHEVSPTLGEVKKIKNLLDLKGVCVVHGVPSGGKKDQVRLAVPEGLGFFDLKEKASGEAGEGYVDYTSEQSTQLRLDWIKENRDQIIQELIDSEDEVIAFTEFDVGRGRELTPNESAFMKEVLGIAKEVQAKKKVVLIVHNKGLNAPDFVQQLQSDFSVEEKDIVRAKYLLKPEEKRLLQKLPWSEVQKNLFMNRVQGLPAAYMYLLREEGSLTESYEELLSNVKSRVENVWEVAQVNADPEVIHLLVEIASGRVDCNGPECRDFHQKLFQTGLFAKRGGHYYIPPLVAEVIRERGAATTSKIFISGRVKEKSATPVDFKLLDKGAKYWNKEMVLMGKIAGKYGGYSELTIGERVFLQSKEPAQISKALTRAKSAVNKRIGFQQEPAIVKEMKFWKNSATTIEGLIQAAEQNKDAFMDFCRQAANSAGGGTCHFGENNMFVTKSQESLERKVEGDWREVQRQKINLTYADVVQSVGDSVRGSISVDSPEQVGEVMRSLKNQCEAKGWKIGFKNIWEDDRAGGYGGVHAKMQMRTDSGEWLICELQIHLTDIYDGTLHCVKNSAHEIYEYAREAYTPDHLGAIGRQDNPDYFANQISRLMYLSHIDKYAKGEK